MPGQRAAFGSHSASPAELKAQLAAERRGQPFLVYRDGADTQRIVPLDGETSRLTVGRNQVVDIRLEWDRSVSGLHAELERRGTHWTVVDDGLSRNGTFVNERRVEGRARLTGGDVVRFGETPVAYRAPFTRGDTLDAPEPSIPEISASERRVLVGLCRPYADGPGGRPASNKEIADELVLSIEGVKWHMRALFERFGVEDLPRNQKRVRLAELAFASGVITQAELS